MSDRALRRGRVIDAEGHPVTNALVSVTWGTAPTPDIARRTDASGAFQVALPPGRFRVRAVTTDGRAGEVEVAGAEGKDIIIRVDVRAG
jgi:hypothetical protein